MRQRRIEALQRCAKRAEGNGLPVAAVINPFERPMPDAPYLPISTVLIIAAQVTGVSVGKLVGSNAARRYAVPRQFACWLLRERLGMSGAKLGAVFNKSAKYHEWAIAATNQRLADGDWLIVTRWRAEAAELLSRIDTDARRGDRDLLRRQRERMAAIAKHPPLPPMDDEERRLYGKLRRAGIDRVTALKAASQQEHTVVAR